MSKMNFDNKERAMCLILLAVFSIACLIFAESWETDASNKLSSTPCGCRISKGWHFLLCF